MSEAPAVLPSASAAALARRETRRRTLGDFFAPETIAVIGASPRAGSVGRTLLENLATYGGRVFPVNPRHPAILGRPCFARVGDLPVRADLALIATPADTVPAVVRECVEAGLPAAIVLSAGFKECGAEGAELELRVRNEARRGGLRLIGPNCLGLMCPHLGLNATFAPTIARPGSVGFVSQSGALCTAVLDWSLREHVGFSAFVSLGSMGDVGWAELITSLGDDPHTRSIILYMESIGDARAFMSAARETALSKPIIVVKAGRTEEAARAAASHTGALTGSDAVADAAFRRAGVLRVDTIEDLFDMAEALAKQPNPRGPRLGLVTNAGGPAALAVDRLVAGGAQLAVLEPATLQALDRVLPAHWSRANPVDILGDASAGRFAQAVELVCADANTDGVLVVLTPQAGTDAVATAEALRRFSVPASGKPFLASFMGGPAVEAGEAVLNAAGIPTFKYADRAAQIFSNMWRYQADLKALYETPTLQEPRAERLGKRSRPEEIIRGARLQRRTLLTPPETKALLATCGLPVVEAFPAESEDEAVSLAARMGYPVAVKLPPRTPAYEGGADGVYLNLHDATRVRQAWRALRRSRAGQADGREFPGVTVEKMIGGEGCDVILGSSVDPQFGPVLRFGAGGRRIESGHDRAIGFPPLNSTLARRLMEQTRIYGVLKEGRGGTGIDLAALEHLLVRFSQLVAEQRWIREIDLNPLRVTADRMVALGARIVLHDPGMTADELPPLAIRPYPRHLASKHRLKDGTAISLRAIRPEDEPMMVRFHETLSDQSVYFRYFTSLSLKQRTNHARLARLCFIDYDREMALVATREEPSSSRGEILAVGRLCRAHGRNQAEFALVVSDRWQRRGLGSLLLRRLVEVGREEKLARITGTVLAENHEMRRLCERTGFTLQSRLGEPEFVASINL